MVVSLIWIKRLGCFPSVPLLPLLCVEMKRIALNLLARLPGVAGRVCRGRAGVCSLLWGCWMVRDG